MVDLVLSLVSAFFYKPHVIWNVFKDIDHKKKIEVFLRVLFP